MMSHGTSHGVDRREGPKETKCRTVLGDLVLLSCGSAFCLFFLFCFLCVGAALYVASVKVHEIPATELDFCEDLMCKYQNNKRCPPEDTHCEVYCEQSGWCTATGRRWFALAGLVEEVNSENDQVNKKISANSQYFLFSEPVKWCRKNLISECFARKLKEDCQSDETELRNSIQADLCQLQYKPPYSTDTSDRPGVEVYESESLWEFADTRVPTITNLSVDGWFWVPSQVSTTGNTKNNVTSNVTSHYASGKCYNCATGWNGTEVWNKYRPDEQPMCYRCLNGQSVWTNNGNEGSSWYPKCKTTRCSERKVYQGYVVVALKNDTCSPLVDKVKYGNVKVLEKCSSFLRHFGLLLSRVLAMLFSFCVNVAVPCIRSFWHTFNTRRSSTMCSTLSKTTVVLFILACPPVSFLFVIGKDGCQLYQTIYKVDYFFKVFELLSIAHDFFDPKMIDCDNKTEEMEEEVVDQEQEPEQDSEEQEQEQEQEQVQNQQNIHPQKGLNDLYSRLNLYKTVASLGVDIWSTVNDISSLKDEVQCGSSGLLYGLICTDVVAAIMTICVYIYQEFYTQKSLDSIANTTVAETHNSSIVTSLEPTSIATIGTTSEH